MPTGSPGPSKIFLHNSVFSFFVTPGGVTRGAENGPILTPLFRGGAQTCSDRQSRSFLGFFGFFRVFGPDFGQNPAPPRFGPPRPILRPILGPKPPQTGISGFSLIFIDFGQNRPLGPFLGVQTGIWPPGAQNRLQEPKSGLRGHFWVRRGSWGPPGWRRSGGGPGQTPPRGPSLLGPVGWGGPG